MATNFKVLLCALGLLVVFAASGCVSSDRSYVQLVHSTNESVFVEYDEYVRNDETLTPTQRDIRLRLTQTLREVTQRKLNELSTSP